MNSVVITGYGIVVKNFSQPKSLFNHLASGKSLISEDERLKNMGIERIPSASLSNDDRQIIFQKVRNNKIYLLNESIVQGMALSSIIDSMEMSKLTKADLSTKRYKLFFANNKMFPTVEDLFKYAKNIKETSLIKDIEKECQIPLATDIFSEIAYKLNSFSLPQIFSDACTAGMSALDSAFYHIRHGEADIAVVCASEEATHPIMQVLFKKVGALYHGGKFKKISEASRAFDKLRSGCVLADAAACIIIEKKSHAISRNVRPLVEIKGMHRNAEAHKMTSSDADGFNYLSTMTKALSDADIAPRDIDHINAHGTSTIINDQTESKAIASLFKSKCPPVISTKSALGHSLGVSGLLECILSCESILENTLLPSLNFNEQSSEDGKIAINKRTIRNAKVNNILSNSFGFGGENCSIVLSRIEEGL